MRRNIKTIVFIEPRSPGYHVYSLIKIPRLGLPTMGAILKNEGYDVRIYCEENEGIDFEDVLRADAVGISTLTSTAPRAYTMAKEIKEATGVPVFMGGPHVSFLPDEALNYCDFVFRGEADETIVSFIKALEAGEGFEKIPGLSYKVEGHGVSNPDAPLPRDMDAIPDPDLSLFQGKPFKNVMPIMTSRGCPYDCTFCSVTAMFGRRFRTRSIERVVAEFKRLLEAGGDWFFIYDDIFNANPRRCKNLLRRMIEEGATPPWGAQVRVEVAKDPELLELMKKANGDILYIGFESINPKTLEEFSKRQTVEDIERAIKEVHKYGMKVHGMFMAGADEDDVETIRKTAEFAIENDIDTIQIMALVPIPGTHVYTDIESQGRLLTKDWSRYDAHHAVLQPKNMTPFELQWEIIQALMKFYSWPQIIKGLARFDLRNVMYKIYGRSIIKNWRKINDEWVRTVKELSIKGKEIEIMARETADDVKKKMAELCAKYGYGTGAKEPLQSRVTI